MRMCGRGWSSLCWWNGGLGGGGDCELSVGV